MIVDQRSIVHTDNHSGFEPMYALCIPHSVKARRRACRSTAVVRLGYWCGRPSLRLFTPPLPPPDRSTAAKRAKGLKHPQLCLDAIQCGVEHGGMAGLIKVGGHGRADQGGGAWPG